MITFENKNYEPADVTTCELYIASMRRECIKAFNRNSDATSATFPLKVNVANCNWTLKVDIDREKQIVFLSTTAIDEEGNIRHQSNVYVNDVILKEEIESGEEQQDLKAQEYVAMDDEIKELYYSIRPEVIYYAIQRGEKEVHIKIDAKDGEMPLIVRFNNNIAYVSFGKFDEEGKYIPTSFFYIEDEAPELKNI